MIFATDLDNTMIYSHKLIQENDSKFTCVEYYHDKPITYMTNTSIEKLKLLMEKTIVIPVTTRSIEQFNRISFFKNCKYSIVANGGIILIDGKPDLEYLEIRNQWLKSYDFKQPIDIISRLPQLELQPRFVDESFVFAKVKNPEQSKEILKEKLDTKIWQIHSIGNKIYVIPDIINKGCALKYLVEGILKRSDHVIAAGDSLLDIPMLKYSNYPVVPFECELLKQNLNVFKVGENIFSADDILRLALNWVK